MTSLWGVSIVPLNQFQILPQLTTKFMFEVDNENTQSMCFILSGLTT